MASDSSIRDSASGLEKAELALESEIHQSIEQLEKLSKETEIFLEKLQTKEGITDNSLESKWILIKNERFQLIQLIRTLEYKKTIISHERKMVACLSDIINGFDQTLPDQQDQTELAAKSFIQTHLTQLMTDTSDKTLRVSEEPCSICNSIMKNCVMDDSHCCDRCQGNIGCTCSGLFGSCSMCFRGYASSFILNNFVTGKPACLVDCIVCGKPTCLRRVREVSNITLICPSTFQTPHLRYSPETPLTGNLLFGDEVLEFGNILQQDPVQPTDVSLINKKMDQLLLTTQQNYNDMRLLISETLQTPPIPMLFPSSPGSLVFSTQSSSPRKRKYNNNDDEDETYQPALPPTNRETKKKQRTCASCGEKGHYPKKCPHDALRREYFKRKEQQDQLKARDETGPTVHVDENGVEFISAFEYNGGITVYHGAEHDS